MDSFYIILLPSLLAVCLADRSAVSSMMGAHKLGEKMVGSNRCTWGPSYWCDGVKSAKECSAVNHCVQNVWGKQEATRDASEICKWCDDLMDDIRELVNANTSKLAMRGYIKDGCRRIPVHTRRATCVDEILADLSEIRQMLTAKIPDRTICKTINFCDISDAPSKSSQVDIPFTKILPAVNSNRNYCVDCHNFFEDAKEIYIGNYTEDEFKQMLLQNCEQVGYAAITELCKTVIEQYWPQIYSRLKIFFDPEEACVQLNFCTETAAIKRTWKLPFTPFSSSAKSTPAQLPLNRMLLNFDGFMAKKEETEVVKKLEVKSDVKCVLCEFVMSYVDKLLADNYTEAAIQSALAKVCSMMPSSVRRDCHSFIEQYAPAIFTILSQELDPEMVCSGLQLCTSSGKTEAAVISGGCGSGASCESCSAVFQSIKDLMDSYEETARLAEQIKSYCQFFPTEAREQCETAVTTYVPYGLQMMAQLIKPEMVCKAVKMCP